MGKWKIISYRKCNINSIKQKPHWGQRWAQSLIWWTYQFPKWLQTTKLSKGMHECERYCNRNKKKYLHSRYVYLFNNIFQWCSHFLQHRFVKREFGCRLCWFGNCWCSWRNGFWCARPFFLIILLFFSDLTIWSD